jgi:TatA/E family protein of Tat protein translocase
MNLGPAEIIVILVVALVVFGPKRLPEVGRQVGGALREIRKVQDTVRTEISSVINDEPTVDRTGPSPRPTVHEAEPDDDHDEHDEAVGALPPVRRLDDPDQGPSGSFS